MLVFLIVLSLAACLPAQITSQDNVDAYDIIFGVPHIDVSEASNMVYTSVDPNYWGEDVNDPNYVRGFICDTNQLSHAYWKVGCSTEVNGPNDPNITPVLRGDGSLVLVFVLPAKTASKVTLAHLVSYAGYVNGLEFVDLYGIRTVAAGTPLGDIVQKSDHYAGAFGCDPDATPIQTEYNQTPYSGGSRNSWHITGYSADQNGPARLRCWLQKQYDEGAVGGDYVLLRLNFGGYRTIVPPAIAEGLNSYHVAPISSMWDNPKPSDVNDHNEISIPLTQLKKLFTMSPRLYIKFAATAAACPNEVEHCCRDLQGDLTGNCAVDVCDISLLEKAWLDTLADVEVNNTKLLSHYTFDGNTETKWDNSVAGGHKIIPFDACEPNTGGTVITDDERGRVGEISSSTDWLYVGPIRSLILIILQHNYRYRPGLSQQTLLSIG